MDKIYRIDKFLSIYVKSLAFYRLRVYNGNNLKQGEELWKRKKREKRRKEVTEGGRKEGKSNVLIRVNSWTWDNFN